MEQELRYKALQKTSIITIIVNVVLAVFKMVIGLFSGSTAVVSDGVHTISDVFTTVIVMVGLRFSSAKADEEHPYGHQRIESLISLLLAVSLVLTALYLGYEGVQKLMSHEIVEPSWLALGITFLSIASKEWMFQYTKRQAKKFNSSSMMSDAWHHRTDAISSVAVLIGVAGVFFGAWFLDPVATIAVCFIILKAAFDIGKVAVNQLIDHSADKEIDEKISAITMEIEGVENIDLLRTRISNNVIFVDLEICVDGDITVKEGHKIAQEVHDVLEEEMEMIAHCMVHVNPSGEEEHCE